MQTLYEPNYGDDPEAPRVSRQRITLAGSERLGWLVNLALAVLLLALLLIPRLRDLDALVTPDEPLWVARSANFYQALASGDFEQTYQAAHPGVVTMWLGTLAYWLTDPDLPDRMGGQIGNSEVRSRVIPAGELPIGTLTELRTAMVVANALLVIATFLCLVPIVGRWTALLAAAFLGLDPMQIGFSRLLHQDGLSANLLILALVAYVWRLQTGSRTGLALAGIAAGLAVLTRSVNGVLIPLLGLLTIIDLLASARAEPPRARAIKRHATSLLVCGVIALVTVFALWPALWIAPISTIDKLISGGSDLAAAPHQRQVLFRGQIITGDPGRAYYPIVLAYRMTPLALLGVGLAGIALLARSAADDLINHRLVLSLAGFAATYLAILTLAVKKLDRYVLPSLAALDLVAALGATAATGWLARRLATSGRGKAMIAVAASGLLLLAGQAVPAIGSAPYYLTYVSPVMGGTDDARGEISLGWGEGGKAAADALRDQPRIGPANAVGGLWPQTIDYYLRYELGGATYELDSTGAERFLDGQYLIVTEPEIQRQFYPPSMIAWFETQEPVMTVRDDGRVYARVFDIANIALPEPYYHADAPIYTWGEARLVAATFRDQIEPGMDLRVRLTFETTGEPFYYWIHAKVVDGDGVEVGSTSKRLRAETAENGMLRSVFDIVLPDSLPLGDYTVRMSIRDRETGEQVTGVHAPTGQETERSVALGTFSMVRDIDEPDP